MLIFKFKSNRSLPLDMPKSYPDILIYEGSFRIIVDEKVFFEDENFAIFEFLTYVNKWISNCKENMLYECMDTEDNPLIGFYFCEDGWLIDSPWKNFKMHRLFSTDELKTAILNLIDQCIK